MNRKLKLLGLFVGAAVIGHVGLVMAVPHAIMNVAMNRISGDGARINQFSFGPRTTKIRAAWCGHHRTWPMPRASMT